MGSNLRLFEAAACGTSLDEAQLMAEYGATLKDLLQRGVIVERYNYRRDRQAYIEEPMVAEILEAEGEAALPITIIDGKVVATGNYLDPSDIYMMVEAEESSSCGSGGCSAAPVFPKKLDLSFNNDSCCGGSESSGCCGGESHNSGGCGSGSCGC